MLIWCEKCFTSDLWWDNITIFDKMENGNAFRVLGYDSESRMTTNLQFTHPFDEVNLLNWNDLDLLKSHRITLHESKCYYI